ncbi:MAG: rhodanese-like domain-containing protein [Spirochaetota bacterium]
MKANYTSFIFIGSILLLALLFIPNIFGQQKNRAETAWDWVLKNKAVLIDVRTPEEFKSGHLDNAVNLPLDRIADMIKTLYPYTSTPMVLYCRSGNRSQQAYGILKSLGYTQLFNGGGYQELLSVKPAK